MENHSTTDSSEGHGRRRHDGMDTAAVAAAGTSRVVDVHQNPWYSCTMDDDSSSSSSESSSESVSLSYLLGLGANTPKGQQQSRQELSSTMPRQGQKSTSSNSDDDDDDDFPKRDGICHAPPTPAANLPKGNIHNINSPSPEEDDDDEQHDAQKVNNSNSKSNNNSTATTSHNNCSGGGEKMKVYYGESDDPSSSDDDNNGDDDDDVSNYDGDDDGGNHVPAKKTSTTGGRGRHQGDQQQQQQQQPTAAAASSSRRRERHQQQWEEMFRQLLKFQHDHGHLHVPSSYPPNPRLSVWVCNQINARSRIQRGLDKIGRRITQARIDRLNEIGFSWKGTPAATAAAVAAVAAAVAATTITAPQHVDDKEEAEEDEMLEEYSSRQGHVVKQRGRPATSRRRRNTTTCSTTTSSGVAPPPPRPTSTGIQHQSSRREQRQQRWEEMFQQLLQFQRTQGHLHVPPKYLPNQPLANWYFNQINGYSRIQRGLDKIGVRITQARIDRLNQIGFPWKSISRAGVVVTNAAAVATTTPTSTRHSPVHHGRDIATHEGEEEDNDNDSAAAVVQHAAPEEQQRQYSWDKMYELLMQFKEREGHTCVPQKVPKLGPWVNRQRAAFRRKQRGLEHLNHYRLTQERLELLNAIEFVWDARPSAAVPIVRNDQQPQEGVVMVSTSPMMDAADVTTLQDQHRPPQRGQRSVRKLMARKSLTGATSSCVQNSTTVTPGESEHVRSPPQVTHLSYSAARCGTGHDEGTAAAARSADQRKRKRHGSGGADSEESSPITTIQASTETIHFEDVVGHVAAKVHIGDILYSPGPPESNDEHEFTYLPSQPTSILMHGPSGCGKTLLARAIAGEAKATFLSINPSGIRGDLKAAARSIFQQAQEHARGHQESNCAVIFIDDIDDNHGHVHDYSRGILQEMFIQRDKTTTDARVLIVAATNCLKDCDSALARRFGARLHVGLPTEHDRKEMFTRHVAEFVNVLTQDEIVTLSKATDGWSGLELKNLTRDAAMTPMREYLRAARMRREKLQETRGHLPVPQEGVVSVEEGGSIPLRPVVLADFEKAMNLRFDTVV